MLREYKRMTPSQNLLIASAVGFCLVCLFWPARGLLWRWLRGRTATERVLIEDALTHCYDCEYEHTWATLESLAGALEIRRNDAARLSARLESLGLLEPEQRGVKLTAEGRGYALRVIRIHRLWERFLADRTGVGEAEWHARADRVEHTMTATQADQLYSQLGYPRFDPHGDPIPTPSGEMPQRRGAPLSTLEAGATAVIVHVEDEPSAVYAQIVALRLYPGMSVRVLESTADQIRIEADAQERLLAPIVAANVTVERIAELDENEPRRLLSSLAVGQRATVVDLSPACRGGERRRLLDLGIVPGTAIEAELRSPGGGPTAYRIRGALIGLRAEQADLIHIAPAVAAQTAERH